MSDTARPALRFKGYDDEWGATTFAAVVRLVRGLTYTPADLRPPGEGVRVLRSSNIDEDAFRLRGDDVFVDPAAVDIPRISDGDIIVTASNGSPRLVGKHAIVRKSGAEPMVHGGFMLAATSDQPDFVQALMSSPWYSRALATSTSGGNGAIGNLDRGRLEQTAVSVPSSAERHHIGRLGATLDAALDLHQHRHAALQQSKASLLHGMFPAPGADIPTLRLEGFGSDWTASDVAACAAISKGQGYSKSDVRAQGTPVVLYGRLYTKYTVTISDVDTFATLKPRSVLSTGREVLVPASGETPEDIVRASALLQEGVIIGGDLNILQPREGIDPAFLALSIGHGVARDVLVSRAQGKSVVHLRGTDLRDAPVLLPSLEEQQAIGALFARLDELIDAEQQYVRKLRQVKTALLQKMFV